MLAHITAGGRLATVSTLPRATRLSLVRPASSSSGKKNNDEPSAVSTPTGSVQDSESSPMSQRTLPPDDGKVRT
jgi:hypothetical protein